MGPYCNFCGRRCFVPFPAGTPQQILRAYPEGVSIIATCYAGQRDEERRFGWGYDNIIFAIDSYQPGERDHHSNGGQQQ